MRGLRWLIVRTLIIVVVAVVAITGAIFIGRQQPTPDNLALLHLTDCELPCWIGIVPGKTTLAEAEARIRQVYGNAPGYVLQQDDDEHFVLINQKRDDDGIEIGLHECDSRATQSTCVEIDLSQSMPTGDPDLDLPQVGSLISLVGRPSQAVLYDVEGDSHVSLLFEKYHLDLVLRYGDCGSSTLDERISIGQNTTALEINSQVSGKANPFYFSSLPWRGFPSSCYGLASQTP